MSATNNVITEQSPQQPILQEGNGLYGEFGGSFVPPELQKVLDRLTENFLKYKDDPAFQQEFQYYLKHYVGRPNPLTRAFNLERYLNMKDKNNKIYLKREDLNHLGSHKINNVLGQILLAKRMGAKRVIAETGAGQHGVATACACALFDNIECVIYMGKEDVKRQALNVFRMQMLGAKVISVEKGQGRLKDAVDEALGDLIKNYENTFYLLGSAVGPHPFPMMVKHFQSIISKESKEQVMELEGKLPTRVLACVGGGSNAIGAFSNYIEDKSVELICVEPKEAASLTEGKPFILHGFKTLTLLEPIVPAVDSTSSNNNNTNNKEEEEEQQQQPRKTYSIAAGLDYPGVSPIFSHLISIGRCSVGVVDKNQVLEAFQILSKTEGIIPALESTHAIAYLIDLARNGKLGENEIIIINLSGRGDKDVEQVYEMMMKNGNNENNN
ncbi:hypothetical protein ABK040_012795 [Willaertia magna]